MEDMAVSAITILANLNRTDSAEIFFKLVDAQVPPTLLSGAELNSPEKGKIYVIGLI